MRTEERSVVERSGTGIVIKRLVCALVGVGEPQSGTITPGV